MYKEADRSIAWSCLLQTPRFLFLLHWMSVAFMHLSYSLPVTSCLLTLCKSRMQCHIFFSFRFYSIQFYFCGELFRENPAFKTFVVRKADKHVSYVQISMGIIIINWHQLCESWPSEWCKLLLSPQSVDGSNTKSKMMHVLSLFWSTVITKEFYQ